MFGIAVYVMQSAWMEGLAPEVLPLTAASATLVAVIIIRGNWFTGRRTTGASADTELAELQQPTKATPNIKWKIATFVSNSDEAEWLALRAQISGDASPRMLAVLDAVVPAARRLCPSGSYGFKKDALWCEILAAPEVVNLGAIRPRMDVVRKIVEGTHPTLAPTSKRSSTG